MRDDNLVVNLVDFIVGLLRLDGRWRHRLRLERGGLALLLLLPSQFTHVENLDDDVHEDADEEHHQHHVELHAGA